MKVRQLEPVVDHEPIADLAASSASTLSDPCGRSDCVDQLGDRQHRQRRGRGGLSTIGHPAASAGATLCAASPSGRLNGLIAATAPTGNRLHDPDAPAGRRVQVEREHLAVDPLGLLGCDPERRARRARSPSSRRESACRPPAPAAGRARARGPGSLRQRIGARPRARRRASRQAHARPRRRRQSPARTRPDRRGTSMRRTCARCPPT